MPYDVSRKAVASVQVLAVRDRAIVEDLPSKIGQNTGRVLEVLQKADAAFGRCVVVYLDHAADKALLASPEGVAIDVGWEVEAPVGSQEADIRLIQTPTGDVASTIHVGPYEDIHEAHVAIRDRCDEQGWVRAGTNWEIYEHPQQGKPPRTEVVYLLS